MEEASNGKLEEEILRVESSEDKNKEVITEDSGELKTEDGESVTVGVVDGNSESLTVNEENHDGGDSSSSSSSNEEAEPEEKTPHKVDSGEFEKEKLLTVSVIDSVNREAPQSEELNDGEEAAVVQIAEAPEDVTLSDSTNGVSEEVSIEASKVDGEATLPPPSDEKDGISSDVTEVVSKALPSSEENGEILVPVPVAINEEESKAIQETKLPESVQKTGESSYTVDKESNEHEDEKFPALANSGNVENSADAHETANTPEISERSGNSPIISPSQRTVRPTSWRSCCGLLEALRRSDR